MRNETFSEELWRGLGNAVADLRAKLVDEAWYGRVVSERDGQQVQPIAGWPQAREAQPEASDHQHDSVADRDIDR